MCVNIVGGVRRRASVTRQETRKRGSASRPSTQASTADRKTGCDRRARHLPYWFSSTPFYDDSVVLGIRCVCVSCTTNKTVRPEHGVSAIKTRIVAIYQKKKCMQREYSIVTCIVCVCIVLSSCRAGEIRFHQQTATRTRITRRTCVWKKSCACVRVYECVRVCVCACVWVLRCTLYVDVSTSVCVNCERVPSREGRPPCSKTVRAGERVIRKGWSSGRASGNGTQCNTQNGRWTTSVPVTCCSRLWLTAHARAFRRSRSSFVLVPSRPPPSRWSVADNERRRRWPFRVFGPMSPSLRSIYITFHGHHVR